MLKVLHIENVNIDLVSTYTLILQIIPALGAMLFTYPSTNPFPPNFVPLDIYLSIRLLFLSPLSPGYTLIRFFFLSPTSLPFCFFPFLSYISLAIPPLSLTHTRRRGHTHTQTQLLMCPLFCPMVPAHQCNHTYSIPPTIYTTVLPPIQPLKRTPIHLFTQPYSHSTIN